MLHCFHLLVQVLICLIILKKEEKSLKNMSYQNYRRQVPPKESVFVSAPNTTVLIVVGILVVFGLMSIFSVGAPESIERGQNPAHFALMQLLYIVAGFFGLRFFTNFDYKNLSVFAFLLALFVIFMLILVNFTPLGVTVNFAKRWINILGFQFQPSEVAKPVCILLLANAFHRDSNIWDSRKWMKCFLPILIMMGLIYKQPNLSMVILLLSTSFIMYFSTWGSVKTLITGTFVGVTSLWVAFKAALAGLIPFIYPHQLSRLQVWLNPEIDPYDKGYNIIQSLIAFAAGGFWGVGFGNSKQKLYWLPEKHTDFIFAVIAEEHGFLGCLLVIGLFWTLIHQGLIIASKCEDMFGKLIAVGITLSIGLQALINMAVTSSLVPATGIPLPFISYGGTSIIVSMAMVGILLNISKKRIKRLNYETQRY